jgi:(S)-ureidoglycine aminohydrolase
LALPFVPSYAFPPGGMPAPDADPAANGAIFTTAYAVIPASVQRDIVTSLLPGWDNTRAWILARPLSGFAETFAQYAVEVTVGGKTPRIEPDTTAEGVFFVVDGTADLWDGKMTHPLKPGSYVYLPPTFDSALNFELKATSDLKFHWVRRVYTDWNQSPPPPLLVTSDSATPIDWMNAAQNWGTSRFVLPDDLAHDMHVNIVTLLPGGRIPFAETHVMEHGLYVLQGTARYLLNTTWHDVGPGDFMWLRAFCPQACIATGTEPFRYLLYKDVNRHPPLTLGPPPP